MTHEKDYVDIMKIKVYGYDVVITHFTLTRDWGMTISDGDRYYRYFNDKFLIVLIVIGIITIKNRREQQCVEKHK